MKYGNFVECFRASVSNKAVGCLVAIDFNVKPKLFTLLSHKQWPTKVENTVEWYFLNLVWSNFEKTLDFTLIV